MNYHVIVTKAPGALWYVRIPALDGLTQAKTKDEAEDMAREWISLTLDCEPNDFDVTVEHKEPFQIERAP